MIYQRQQLTTLEPEELDRYLEEGWYRWAQTIFTGHILAFPDALYPAAWIRLALPDYKFRKSLRRIMRRNGESLVVKMGPAKITAAKNLLFLKYRASFKGDLFPTLQDALFGSPKKSSVFDTRQLEIYHNDRLIAFSFFDVGGESIASIMGIYDPDYSRFGLGFYTMLLEIEWAKENGKDYFYPGYAVPGNSRFDYKLRIGDVEFFEARSQSWLPWDQFQIEKTPLAELRKKVSDLKVTATNAGLHWLIGHYANFEDPCERLKGNHLLQFPLYLSADDHAENENPIIIEYDLISTQYRLSRYQTVKALPFPNHTKQLAIYSYPISYDLADFVFLGSLVRKEILFEHPEALPVIEHLKNLG
tara:strand:- start:2562 stop:3641 length:1080 start_codon:yes stop_codon:yes gene_type:complete